MTDVVHHFVLLDRDGVINKDLAGSVCAVADFELLPEATWAIAELNRKGYQLLIVTNQACVGRGDLTLAGLNDIHSQLMSEVAMAGGGIEHIYVCPHTDEDNCDCRKPKPGLIERAQQDYGFERKSTWLIGDSDSDIEAATRAGLRSALVRSGKKISGAGHAGVPVFDSLAQFARQLEDHRIES